MNSRDPESVYRSTPENDLPLFEDSEHDDIMRDMAAACEQTQMADRLLYQCGKEIAHARKTDRPTSHEAAKSIVNLGRTRDLIISILKTYGPLGDELIAWRYGLFAYAPKVSPSGLRSRRSELVRMGLVEACGEGRTASGRKCMIWRLKEAK